MDRAWIALAGISLITVTLTGCATPQPQPQTITFEVQDGSFSGPDEMPSGWTTLELTNDGQDLHNLQLVRLDEGRTVDELISYVETSNGTFPGWATEMGGPNAPMPGATTQATLELEPGTYAVICIVPGPEGRMHALDGEATTVTVTEETTDGQPPGGDVRLSLVDFAFNLSGTPTEGETVFEIVNEGGEAHEAVIARLDEGATVDDLLAAFGPNASGPPPATFVGGLTAIEPGTTQYATIDLEPGTHAMICFLPAEADGHPHVTKGMRGTFQVAG